MFSAIRYEPGVLSLIDQRKLPTSEAWIPCRTLEQAAIAIEDMVVRGAPAIGITAGFALALDVLNSSKKTWSEYREDFEVACKRLARTRPTAVNLFFALERFKRFSANLSDAQPLAEVKKGFAELAAKLFAEDLATCKQIGNHGLSLIAKPKVRVLTHCNTGSLATAGYGTALGIIRSLHAAGRLEHVYVDETRPYMQGTRLTAFELKQEEIPFSLQVDSAAAIQMSRGKVDLVVVGADRIAANGDTANKIGTFPLAIAAQYHGVPFYVAAPLSTIDLAIGSGNDIPVEDRPAVEITHFQGHPVAPYETAVENPSFDITDHKLITGIITEKGVVRPPYPSAIRSLF